MIKTKKSIKKVDVTIDVICDYCGNSCKKLIGTNIHKKPIYNFEYMTLESTWGYGSDKDTEHWSAEVCESCVDKKFKNIKFKKTNYL